MTDLSNKIKIKLINKIKEFSSVDTLARFYTLSGPYRGYLNRLKRLIDCYFFIRQFTTWPIIPHRQIWDDRKKVEKAEKLQKYDSRYDSLFAAILNEEHNLPSNTSFLSWNYDLEFERSLSKFTPFAISHSGMSIVHLNGHSKSPAEDEEDKTIENQVLEMLDDDYISQIEYAWEMPQERKEQLEAVLAKTTHLVVIGYSFPVFNRKIDRQILANTMLDKVYIQDLPSALPGIENRVKALLGQRANYAMRDRANEMSRRGVDIGSKARQALLDLVEIETINSTDQFHLPFELT